MTTLQFSLFFVALLLAYALIHLRLVRFEKQVERLSTLETMERRVQRMAENVERLRLDRVEELLQNLVEESIKTREEIRDIEIEASVQQLAPPVSVPSPEVVVQGREQTAGERIRSAVESRILMLGYRDVRILGDLGSATLDEHYEIRIECLRGEMPHKGSVVVRNGAVVDVDLRSVVRSFP